MPCICGHEHEWSEPQVCKKIDCKCEKYVEATPENIVITKHTAYLQHFEHVKDQVAWILDNLRYLRNSKNRDFVDFYFQYVAVYTPRGRKPRRPDYETIRRTKQDLVAEMPGRYGPFDANVVQEKAVKQVAMEEFVTQ